VINTIKELDRLGIDSEFVCVSYAEPSVARNRMVKFFLDTDSDLLIMQDDDVAIAPTIVRRILEFDEAMVGIYLPQRRLDLKRYADHVRAGLPPRAAAHATAPLIGPDTEQDNCILEVDKIGGGFLAIRREAFRQIDRADLAKEYAFGLPGAQTTYKGYFNNLIEEDGASYLGEDYSFCWRYKKAGGRIFAYKGPGITHYGIFGFES
jgi:GT2 family glycosyltransferase